MAKINIPFERITSNDPFLLKVASQDSEILSLKAVNSKDNILSRVKRENCSLQKIMEMLEQQGFITHKTDNMIQILNSETLKESTLYFGREIEIFSEFDEEFQSLVALINGI